MGESKASHLPSILLANWISHYARMELRGCDCTRVLHCTAVNKSANLDPLWIFKPSSHHRLQWSTKSSKCSIHKEHTKFEKKKKNHISTTVQLRRINVSHKQHTSLPLLESSLFPFSGSQYRFLSISGTPRQMVFRARPWTSREPDTWGARGTEDYGISNLSTRAVFRLSVSER